MLIPIGLVNDLLFVLGGLVVNLSQFPAKDKFEILLIQGMYLGENADSFRFDERAGLVARCYSPAVLRPLQKIMRSVNAALALEIQGFATHIKTLSHHHWFSGP